MATLLLFLSTLAADPFTLAQITGYAYPNELTAVNRRAVFGVNQRGLRNLYAAAGPSYTPRQLTSYQADDGQELTSVTLSADGSRVVYVRGGDHGSNFDARLPVNPAFHPMAPQVEIWTAPFEGGAAPQLIGEGDKPALSPDGKTIAFLRGGQVWTAPSEGGKPARPLFHTRGMVTEIQWSPDSSALAFVSNRGDHSFIGVFRRHDSSLSWISPDFSHDRSPRWSPDSRQIAFTRQPGEGGGPEPILARRHAPWSIWVSDAASGRAKKLWTAPETLAGSYPMTEGGTNLHWSGAAGGRIVFVSYQDGWPHLYSLPASGEGGGALLLTPGRFAVEHVKMSADGRHMLFSANTGPDPLDVDRRHIARCAVDKQAVEVLTPGGGIETQPVDAGDGNLLFFAATPVRPALLAMREAGGLISLPGASLLPTDWPAPAAMVTPKQVTFTAPDGLTVHGQLFEGTGNGKRPGVVYVHGGPSRQMLLGWHYGDYYANAYALNQYLASRGFTVLAVNYRLGIGYGFDFQRAANGGAAGASEYQDVKAAGEWLARQPGVDPARVGIYGGSYGGYLTAMALARDSKLFAAGVDVHGVHERSLAADLRYEKAPDAAKAAEVAWSSSPVAHVAGWRSPVLIIHADDDRNVRFSQSTDLVRRLEKAKVEHETMVIVDDTHHFMRHANQARVNAAIAEFLERKLMPAARKKPSDHTAKDTGR